MLSAATQSSQTTIKQLLLRKRTLNFQGNGSYHLSDLQLLRRGGCGVTANTFGTSRQRPQLLLLPLVYCHRNLPSVYADSYVIVLQLWLWTGSISSWHIQLRLLYSLQHQEFIKKLEGFLFFLDNQLAFLPPGQRCSLSAQRHPLDLMNLWERCDKQKDFDIFGRSNQYRFSRMLFNLPFIKFVSKATRKSNTLNI